MNSAPERRVKGENDMRRKKFCINFSDIIKFDDDAALKNSQISSSIVAGSKVLIEQLKKETKTSNICSHANLSRQIFFRFFPSHAVNYDW